MWRSDKGYENALSPGLIAGAAMHGDTVEVKEIRDYAGPEGDGGIIVGVVKREVLWDHQRQGVNCIYLDKGFTRERAIWQGDNLPGWWRMCINAVHPTDYMMRHKWPFDRMAEQFWRGRPPKQREQQPTDHILIAGSSAKFHHTMGLPHPTLWAGAVIDSIRLYSDLPIVYRPKPSWADAEPVDGARFDHGQKTSIEGVLKDTRCMVTYGSIASVDAIMAGVPCIVLGNAPARPVSADGLEALTEPYWASDDQRLAWAANLAYSQFKPKEISDGTAWGIIREQLSYAGV